MIRSILLLLCILGGEAAKIAIIGGGIGGASTSYHIKKLLGNAAHIDIYEQSDRLGGRTLSTEIEGHVVELGASIIHEDNQLVIQLAKAANLTLVRPESGLLALVGDGAKLVFTESSWKIITLIKLLWNYGFQPWRFKLAVASFLHAFQGLYASQSQNSTFFLRPHEMLRSINCYELTQMTFVQYIQDAFHRYSGFASDFVAAVSKVNYNQNNFDMNAFAGMVSLLPGLDGRVFKIKEGNQQIATLLSQAYSDSVFLKTRVTEIAKVYDETLKQYMYQIISENNGNNNSTVNMYDVVVIAAPLVSTSCQEISMATIPGHIRIPKREYQTVRVTIVKGAVRTTFFGLPPGKMPFDEVLLTEKAFSIVPFNSLSKVASLASGYKALYKMFSTDKIPKTWLDMIFERDYSVLEEKEWTSYGAYPVFDPPENFPKFKLVDDEQLYYVNAWENAASAMEMSALAGKNVALMIHFDVSQNNKTSVRLNHKRIGADNNDGYDDAPTAVVMS